MTRQEQIQQASQNLKIFASRADKGMLCREAFEAGAKWADENPKSPWISVEDRLPSVNNNGESKMVFVRVINKDTKAEWIEQPAKYNINIKDWIAMDFTHIGKRNGMVTHWMPIPKLQEE